MRVHVHVTVYDDRSIDQSNHSSIQNNQSVSHSVSQLSAIPEQKSLLANERVSIYGYSVFGTI